MHYYFLLRFMPNLLFKGFELFDISLYLIVNEETSQSITKTDKEIKITIELPEHLRDFSNFKIVRIHEEETVIFNTEYNSEDHTISFFTNRFSDYVITYDEPISLVYYVGGFAVLGLLLMGGCRWFFIIFKRRKKEKKKESDTVIQNNITA
jgi:hypothetical protein